MLLNIGYIIAINRFSSRWGSQNPQSEWILMCDALNHVQQ